VNQDLQDARDRTITRMWPIATTTEIASVLRVDKSAVSRRAAVLGLTPKWARLAQPKVPVKAAAAPKMIYAPLPPVRPATASSRTLADCGTGCRFPLGDHPEGRADLQLFCCEAIEGGDDGSYCPTHARIAFGRKARK
jgi:hypothetical protein